MADRPKVPGVKKAFTPKNTSKPLSKPGVAKAEVKKAEVKKAVGAPAKPGPVKNPTIKIDSNAKRVRPYKLGYSNYQKAIWGSKEESNSQPKVVKIDSSSKPAPKSDKAGLKAANKPLRSTGMRISGLSRGGFGSISGGGSRPGQIK